MEDVEYISSDSDSDLRARPITELVPRRSKRRRLDLSHQPELSFSCSGCKKTLEADSKIYFVPFCSCLYCGRCVVQPILDRLNRLKSTLGCAALDLVNASVINNINPPASSINIFKCQREGHPQFPGAVECYGTACFICSLEGSSSYKHVYLPCGHPFCTSHITRWFEENERRVCPTCRLDVPEEDAHFKRDGTYALGWPRSFS
ncbi:hypothetical protein CC86DRAFT_169933 [Ophiobolus disseminans]|uniref:RING-type domain-containing protein n=1 Tax=Ophiobolus disseminans TaxID=1469910 RepID=A0A6A6ZBJ4_9PLEO|nr:hypothetical protein CC86DRAFT_169933 [Ophiobolus disseminans]